jgi:hypothetical protein
MTTRASRSRSWQIGSKNLLIVLLWSAIGLAVALAMCWFGLGYDGLPG